MARGKRESLQRLVRLHSVRCTVGLGDGAPCGAAGPLRLAAARGASLAKRHASTRRRRGLGRHRLRAAVDASGDASNGGGCTRADSPARVRGLSACRSATCVALGSGRAGCPLRRWGRYTPYSQSLAAFRRPCAFGCEVYAGAN
jgi:hypothetical protein